LVALLGFMVDFVRTVKGVFAAGALSDEILLQNLL
jgi:hypothetical protein